MILRVRPAGISLARAGTTSGPADDGACYVRITDVPDGVSSAQVMILFAHTAKKRVKKEMRYEFAFSDLW